MTTLTVKINERTKQGKAFLEFAKNFLQDSKSVTIVEEKSPYDPKFVKMIKDAQKRGKFTKVDSKDIWGSLGLK